MADRRDFIQTSYGEGTTPEQALAAAVILRAVEDLTSKDEQDRWEAAEFFFQPRGPWADMRRFYFDAIGVDGEVVHQHFAATLEPPERPDKVWNAEEVLDILPRDAAFSYRSHVHRTTLTAPQFQNRINHLITLGHLVRLVPGLFCVPEFATTYWEQRKQAELDAIDELLTGT